MHSILEYLEIALGNNDSHTYWTFCFYWFHNLHHPQFVEQQLLIDVESCHQPSLETQGQLVRSVQCSWWEFTVRSRRSSVNSHHEHCIDPNNCPWVSEDGHQLEGKIHWTKPVFCFSPSWLSFLLLFFSFTNLKFEWMMGCHCFLKCFSTYLLTLLEKQIPIPPKKAVEF